MDENKYVFRFYNVYTDPENKDKFSFNSPYVGRNDDSIASYTRLGEKQYEGSEPRIDEDYLLREDPITEENAFERGAAINYEDDDDIRVGFPHRGLSVIGLNDPKYSLYPFDMLDYDFIKDANALVYKRRGFNAPVEYTKPKLSVRMFGAIPKQVQDVYKKTFNSFLKDKYNMPYAIEDIFDEHGNFISPTSDKNIAQYIFRAAKDASRAMNNLNELPGIKPANLVYSKNGRSVIPEGFDWMRLLDALNNTQDWSNANALVLAQLPESALYNVHDYNNGVTAAHTDFPEELLARYVTPISIKGTGNNADEDSPEDSGIMRGIRGYFNERNNDPKRNDINRQYWEDRARTFIENNFNIDSNKIVSDEIKKYIYKDLSSWYNKNNTDKNILDGLTQGGRRWQ